MGSSYLQGIVVGQWVVREDFNGTRYMEEKRDSNTISRAMTSLSLLRTELLDPPLLGGLYTWARRINSHISSRLDRFLFFSVWDESFRNIKQASFFKPHPYSSW